MSKKVLVISSSLRKNSNSEALADEFLKGAEESGNTVEKIVLAGKKIDFCRGCLACQKTGQCVIPDDAVEIARKMCGADVLVFATPVYYYGISGQLKTMLDRANPLFVADYAFREVYLLASATEDEEGTFEGPRRDVQGWVECFPEAGLAGTVFAGGVTAPGEIKGHPALQSAYALGKSV